MWRVVGIGVVEGVLVKGDVDLELCVRGRACYAQAHISQERRSHHGVANVLQRKSLRHKELVGVLRLAKGFFRKAAKL